MSLQPWPLDQKIPRVCTVNDCCRILALSVSTFWRQMESGDLRLIEVPRLGRMRRFTGASVEPYTRGKWAPGAAIVDEPRRSA